MTRLETVRKFIDRHIDVEETKSFSNDDNFFKLGFVDSLFAIRIVRFIEAEFAIEVANEELLLENFCSVTNIVGFVERKQAAAAGPPSP